MQIRKMVKFVISQSFSLHQISRSSRKILEYVENTWRGEKVEGKEEAESDCKEKSGPSFLIGWHRSLFPPVALLRRWRMRGTVQRQLWRLQLQLLFWLLSRGLCLWIVRPLLLLLLQLSACYTQLLSAANTPTNPPTYPRTYPPTSPTFRYDHCKPGIKLCLKT